MVKHVRKPKKGGGDWAEDVRQETNHDAFKGMMNLMWNNFEECSHALSFMKKHLQAADATGEDRFTSPPSALQRIDKRFLVQWMASLNVKQLDSQWLDKADCNDAEFLHELASFILSMSLAAQLPMELRRSKALLGTFMTQRARQVGRLDHVCVNIQANGCYDKSKGGPFSLTFTDGRLTKVTHCAGDSAACPDHILVQPDFKMLAWYSDLGASLVKAPARHCLKDFFTNDQGPHRNQLTKQSLKEWTERVKESVADETEALEKGRCKVVETVVLVESGKQAKLKMQEKARETMKKYRDAKAKRSEIELGAAVAVPAS